jgi:MarR family transcriptional regulator, 2-MHQ and catechol-resistance regulon repressor
MEKEVTYKPRTRLALDTLFGIGDASNIIQEKIHAYVKTTGLTPTQFSIINVLGHEGPLKISEIYSKMLIKSGNRTMILDSIEQKNLIKRVFSKNDRREIIIELTTAGQKFFNDNFGAYGDFVEKTLSVLSQAEQKELGAILNKLR